MPKLKKNVARPALTDFEIIGLAVDYRAKTATVTCLVSTIDGSESHSYIVQLRNGEGQTGGSSIAGKIERSSPASFDEEGKAVPGAPKAIDTAFDQVAAAIPQKALRDIEKLLEDLGLMPG